MRGRQGAESARIELERWARLKRHGRQLAKEVRVEEGDGGDGGMDCAAIADGQRGQCEHTALPVAAAQTEAIAVHNN